MSITFFGVGVIIFWLIVWFAVGLLFTRFALCYINWIAQLIKGEPTPSDKQKMVILIIVFWPFLIVATILNLGVDLLKSIAKWVLNDAERKRC